MIHKIIRRFNEWRNRCRSCDVDGIDKSIIGSYKNIKQTSSVKTVTEYRCEICGASWILADKSQFVNKVVRKELFEQWKLCSWLPNADQARVLESISGAPDYYKKSHYFPCSIKLPSGTQCEKAIVIATTGDVFGKHPIDRDVQILTADHHISPSSYALPVAVRSATMVARERSMGYAPVNVIDVNGNKFTLSSQMHFFEKNGVLGPDLSLDDSPYHGKNLVHPDWAEMYLICDMFWNPEGTAKVEN